MLLGKLHNLKICHRNIKYWTLKMEYLQVESRHLLLFRINAWMFSQNDWDYRHSVKPFSFPAWLLHEITQGFPIT